MKSMLVFVAFACLLALVAASPASMLLNTELPPPPRHAAAAAESDHAQSLLAVATEAHQGMSAQAAAEQAVQAQMALAVADSVVQNAAIEMHVTAAGQLSAEEAALVHRTIVIPTPIEPAKPVEYADPPTRDALLKNLGPKGYPWPKKLDNALSTVELAASSRIDQIKRQKHWKTAASKLVEELNWKKSKVQTHVAHLTAEIKALLGKKKQIQNKQLQDKLVARLELTHQNLKKVRRQTHYIKKNEADMIKHKEELSHALEGIKRSLALLKGMKRDRKFPSKGVGEKMKEELGKFDPDLSFEKESDEVRALQFPDAVLLDESADMDDAHPLDHME